MQAEGTVHFVGIGGIGMSGIARMLVQAGVPVSGSDIRESAIIKDFRQRGATIFIGHDAENVQGAREIVVSSAIRPENPELVEARRLGLPIIHRSKKLAELLNSRRGITIAGTHGKTTTSSLAACVLSSAGVVPSYVVGGIINTLADNARAGDSEWFVIEADESDGTLVAYHPEIAILTNVELDHMDFYRDLAHLHEVFGQHVRNIRHGGAFIYCADDEGARRLARETAPQGVEAIPYGITSPDAAYAATDIKFVGLGSTFTLVRRGESVGRVHLSVPGQHNVLNSLAVVAAGERMGLPIDAMIPGLEAFTGVQRRFQVIGRNDHYMVVDDYAPPSQRDQSDAFRRALGPPHQPHHRHLPAPPLLAHAIARHGVRGGIRQCRPGHHNRHLLRGRRPHRRRLVGPDRPKSQGKQPSRRPPRRGPRQRRGLRRRNGPTQRPRHHPWRRRHLEGRPVAGAALDGPRAGGLSRDCRTGFWGRWETKWQPRTRLSSGIVIAIVYPSIGWTGIPTLPGAPDGACF